MIQLEKLTKDMQLVIPRGCGCNKLGDDEYYTKEECNERFARKTDLDVYATKEYVDEATSGITVDAYTKSEADARFQPIGEYATESELDTKLDTSVFNTYTGQTVDYVTSGDVEAQITSKGYLTDITITINNQELHNGGSVEIGEGGTVVVDAEIDPTSENPVQNKVIASALTSVQEAIPTKTSQLQNDRNFATNTYVQEQISALSIPTKTSDLVNDLDFVDGSDFNTYTANTADTLSRKQPTLVSGQNIKTVQGNNILGSGNVVLFWFGTKAEYDAIQTKDPNVLYLTKE